MDGEFVIPSNKLELLDSNSGAYYVEEVIPVNGLKDALKSKFMLLNCFTFTDDYLFFIVAAQHILLESVYEITIIYNILTI